MSNQETSMSAAGVLLRILLSGILAGVLLNSPFFLWDLVAYISHFDIYGEIRLGTPRQQVGSILDKKGITCGFSGSLERGQTVCTFSDFWREYTIAFDPETQLVIRK